MPRFKCRKGPKHVNGRRKQLQAFLSCRAIAAYRSRCTQERLALRAQHLAHQISWGRVEVGSLFSLAERGNAEKKGCGQNQVCLIHGGQTQVHTKAN